MDFDLKFETDMARADRLEAEARDLFREVARLLLENSGLSTENKRLRAALQPFVRMAEEAENWSRGTAFVDMRVSADHMKRAGEALHTLMGNDQP